MDIYPGNNPEINRRKVVKAAGFAALMGVSGVAGCIGERDRTPESSGGQKTGDETVQTRSTDKYGDILVDSDGMSLYLFEKDKKGSGESTCTGRCAESWPPLTVDEEPSKSSSVNTELSTFTRSDGDKQVTVNGWPVYRFSSDEAPGDTKGQDVEGFGGEWYLLNPDGTKIEEPGGGEGENTEETAPGGYGY